MSSTTSTVASTDITRIGPSLAFLLLELGELLGEVPRGDRGGGVVELCVGVQRPILRRVEQLGHELMALRIDTAVAQPWLRLEPGGKEVGSGEDDRTPLVGGGTRQGECCQDRSTLSLVSHVGNL